MHYIFIYTWTAVQWPDILVLVHRKQNKCQETKLRRLICIMLEGINNLCLIFAACSAKTPTATTMHWRNNNGRG